MTIRKELEKLGPEAVRVGMVAFEHRGPHDGFFQSRCPEQGHCCFLSHAGGHRDDQWRAAIRAAPRVESAFENQFGGSRVALRAECIAFLAEHGDAKEIAPVRDVVSGSAVVQQEAQTP